jgi:hypothetical protein
LPSRNLLQRGAVGPPPYSQIRGNSRRDRVRSGMREFESSHSSQPVVQLEIVTPEVREIPANGAFLQIEAPSLHYQFGQSKSETAESLWRMFQIFPFSGDTDRRPGSICTAWRIGQSISLCTLIVLAFRVQVFGTDAYCAPLIIAEQLEQMIASLRQGHVDQTARSECDVRR